MYCDQFSLQFGPFPQDIKVEGKTMLLIHIPHNVSMKLAHMASDFTAITQFKQTNSSGGYFIKNLSTILAVYGPRN